MSKTPESILGSILAQLYQREGVGFEIPPNVKQIFVSQPQSLARGPRREHLRKWLEERLDSQGPIFVLLDALEQLDFWTQVKLIGILRSLPSDCLKLLATSRDAPNDDFGLSGCGQMEISAHEEDIRSLVSGEFDSTGMKRMFSRSEEYEATRDKILVKVIDLAQNR